MTSKSGYSTVIEDCFGIKKYETLLVLTNDNKLEISKAFYEVDKEVSKEAVLMVMKSRKVSSEEQSMEDY